MHKTGTTPSDIKGLRLLVGNPYPDRMTFVITPMNEKLTEEVPDAVVQPAEIRLAPGGGRSVIVQGRDRNLADRTRIVRNSAHRAGNADESVIRALKRP